MAYGFKLGQIEGLDSSVKKVNLTITGTTTASYVLNYGNEGGDEGWADNDENPNFSLHYHLELDEYVLIAFNMDETDVGDEYTINLSLPEAPTQAFTEAVGMVTEAINIGFPNELLTLIMTEATPYLPDVIAADGKLCSIPVMTWFRKDAIDKNDFDTLYSEINSIAANTNIAAYCNSNIITRRSFTLYGKISFDDTTRISDYPLKFSYDLAALTDPNYEDPLNIEIRIKVMLITELTLNE